MPYKVKAFFHWMSQQNQHPTYVMKTDGDSFLNLQNLAASLRYLLA
jgi:hypothetical protein